MPPKLPSCYKACSPKSPSEFSKINQDTILKITSMFGMSVGVIYVILSLTALLIFFTGIPQDRATEPEDRPKYSRLYHTLLDRNALASEYNMIIPLFPNLTMRPSGFCIFMFLVFFLHIILLGLSTKILVDGVKKTRFLWKWFLLMWVVSMVVISIIDLILSGVLGMDYSKCAQRYKEAKAADPPKSLLRSGDDNTADNATISHKMKKRDIYDDWEILYDLPGSCTGVYILPLALASKIFGVVWIAQLIIVYYVTRLLIHLYLETLNAVEDIMIREYIPPRR